MSKDGIGCIIAQKMGKENLHDQRNIVKIPPGKLRPGGPSDQIGVNLFETCEKKDEIRVHMSG